MGSIFLNGIEKADYYSKAATLQRHTNIICPNIKLHENIYIYIYKYHSMNKQKFMKKAI